MRKPRVERFWNYIMYTHFSLPTGCRSTNHLISSGFCFNEWKWFSALKKKRFRGFMGYLNNGSTVVFILFLGAQTEIKKLCEVLFFPLQSFLRTAHRLNSGSDGFVTCLEDLWSSPLPFDRINTKDKCLVASHVHGAERRCPCVAISSSSQQTANILYVKKKQNFNPESFCTDPLLTVTRLTFLVALWWGSTIPSAHRFLPVERSVQVPLE